MSLLLLKTFSFEIALDFEKAWDTPVSPSLSVTVSHNHSVN